MAPKPPTVAEEFNFHYKKSVSVGDLRNTTTLSQEEEKFEFHAKPVNPKILQGPVVSAFFCTSMSVQKFGFVTMIAY